MASEHSTVRLRDGPTIAYDSYGSFNLGIKTPIVLICGMMLINDYRGMGNSTLAGDEDITIEMLARDLLFLLHTLGVVAQQLLVLPYHQTGPTPLPFRTTHLLLAGTRSIVQDIEVDTGGYEPAPPKNPRTVAKKKAVAQKVVEMASDPNWIAKTGPCLELICDRAFTHISHRPGEVIGITFAIMFLWWPTRRGQKRNKE